MRLEAGELRYPRIHALSGPIKVYTKSPGKKKLTDITSLQKMPSLTKCREMDDLLQRRQNAVVSCNLGMFTKKTLAMIKKKLTSNMKLVLKLSGRKRGWVKKYKYQTKIVPIQKKTWPGM